MYIKEGKKSTAYRLDNTYMYEYDRPFDSYELDLSEDVEYDFKDINRSIQNVIKSLFNFDENFDDLGFGFGHFKATGKGIPLDDTLNDWKECFIHFTQTLWQDQQDKVIRMCIDYAETCLAFHREYCDVCDKFGDCTATSIWKYRIYHTAQVYNSINPNGADNILLKYADIKVFDFQNTRKSILKADCIEKLIEVLTPYFDNNNELVAALTSVKEPKHKLLFNGSGNLLGNLFGQLYANGHVVGKKYELKDFIKSRFRYKNAGNIIEFKDKYLGKLIEGTENTCKVPITNVNEWKIK